MPDIRDERVAALARQLKVSGDGTYSIDGLRHLILPALLFPELQFVGDRFLGPGWSGVMYYVGEAFGRGIGVSIQHLLGSRLDPEAAIKYMVSGVEIRGFGRTEVSELNLQTGRGVWRFHDCGFGIDDPAKGRTSPSCPFPRGAWAGIVNILGGRDVVAEETHCKGLGDPHCEFVTSTIESVLQPAGTGPSGGSKHGSSSSRSHGIRDLDRKGGERSGD